jgi:hypothetical protein
MALSFENLDERTRGFMLQEVERDIASDELYLSARLTQEGRESYASLLREAVRSGSDETLAAELRVPGRLETHRSRQNRSGTITMAKVPVNAPETLAEGEFNRFYARGLCLRAIEDGITEVEVYRAKDVSQPRAESIAMVGERLSSEALLEDLRISQGMDTALGLPPGPNSGLSVRLP